MGTGWGTGSGGVGMGWVFYGNRLDQGTVVPSLNFTVSLVPVFAY